MMRRLLVCGSLVVLLACMGCDGPKAKEGVQSNIDFSKDYSPKAKPFAAADLKKSDADLRKISSGAAKDKASTTDTPK